MKYRLRKDFSIRVGFDVDGEAILASINFTNRILADLPTSLYKSLDFKTTGTIIGAVFCESLAENTHGVVNPIEKGHPDIVPKSALSAAEKELRNYPQGLEVKCTIGNIPSGGNLRSGQQRVASLTGLTWQAHHRDVRELLGLTWDFVQEAPQFRFPAITAAFYSAVLGLDDWGKISGTTGRNTKVTGMTASGKKKMGIGWVAVLDDEAYIAKFNRLLSAGIG